MVFNSVSGVSDAITIAPSGPMAGQVYDNNAATATPIAVVNYTFNTNIIVNGNDGSAGDSDSLTLDGTDPANGSTSGDDLFTADFAALGGPGTEMIKVTDAANGNPLYNLQTFSNFNTLNANMLGGNDTFRLLQGQTGGITLNINGGAGSNSVEVDGGAGDVNYYNVKPGASNNAGQVTQDDVTAGTSSTINFTQTNTIDIVGSGTGTDILTLEGTQGNDNFQLTGTGPGAGFLTVNSGPMVSFLGLAPTAGIELLGNGGTDTYTITQAFGWGIAGIIVSGNGADTVNLLGTGSGDAYTYTPLDATDAFLTDNDGTSTTTYSLFAIGSLSINARTPTAGTLDVDVPAGDNYFNTPGSQSNSGVVTVTNPDGTDLLPVSYQNIATVTPSTGAIAVVSAPAGGSITVSSAGVVTVMDASGIVVNTQDLSAVSQLDLNVLAGNIAVTIDQGADFAGGIQVIGGNNSDSVTVNATVAGTNTILNFLTNAIMHVVAGPISLLGIADLTLNGTSSVPGPASTFTLNNYGAPTTLTAVTLNANDTATGTDKIVIRNVNGTSTINYTPLSGTAATLTRSEGGPTLNITGFNHTVGDLSVNNTSLLLSANFIGSGSDDSITVSAVGTSGARVVDVVGGNTWVPIDLGTTNPLRSLAILGGLGDDSLTVDDSAGAVALLAGIAYDGGAGTNSLTLTGSTVATSDTYTPGPGAGQGTDTMVIGGATQTVSFTNLAPLTDNVAGPLTVNGTNGNDAITFAGAVISVNGFEAITIANKTNVTLQGLAGVDTFNINNPTGLSGSVTVVGGAGGAGNTLTVNGTTGVDSVDYAPTATNAGTITGLATTVGFTGIDMLTYDGDGGADALTVTTPANGGDGTAVTFTPGATANSGSFAFRESDVAGGGLLTPMSFVNIDQAGSLTLASANPGRTDDLLYNSLNSQDTFEIGLSATHDDITLFNTAGAYRGADLLCQQRYERCSHGRRRQ